MRGQGRGTLGPEAGIKEAWSFITGSCVGKGGGAEGVVKGMGLARESKSLEIMGKEQPGGHDDGEEMNAPAAKYYIGSARKRLMLRPNRCTVQREAGLAPHAGL